jgi:BirA family transcriptional regulator, biotin operon repressor / biotin---[acetyl-CoA-carboxylase] ligase
MQPIKLSRFYSMTDNFWRVQVLGSTHSTQDLVKAMADSGEPEGLAIQALTQTGGRGRHGNQWVSPMGNLYLSVLLRPECPLSDAGQLAFIFALALSNAVDGFMGEHHHITLKWPNDVLVDGKKLAGVLLESGGVNEKGRVSYIIAGTGVNIFAAPDGAIGLDSIKKKPVFVNGFRDVYLEKINFFYHQWQEKGFATLRTAWLKQAHGLNAPMRIRLPEASFSGIFRSIDETGALIAEIEGHERVFTAGEVHFGMKEDSHVTGH